MQRQIYIFSLFAFHCNIVTFPWARQKSCSRDLPRVRRNEVVKRNEGGGGGESEKKNAGEGREEEKKKETIFATRFALASLRS